MTSMKVSYIVLNGYKDKDVQMDNPLGGESFGVTCE
jgi:hypothetical protein